MARRYGTLPSHLLRKADSFDLMVFDVAIACEQLQKHKSQGTVDQSMYDQKELQELMKKTKERNG